MNDITQCLYAIALFLVSIGFCHAWVIDSEFKQPWGERPTPHCIVARCIITGETLRLWVGDSLSPRCPFALNRSELFIAYAADAEVGVFLRLGWPAPLCILDLFPEFLRMVNGHLRRPERKRDGLIDALAHFGEPSMGADEKDEFRALAIRGGPFTDAEKGILVDYCDVDREATERLLGRMWAKANLDDPKVFNQALWRGRYVAAVAAIRAIGVPVNVSLLKRFDANWEALKAALIERLGGRYDVYVNGSFGHRRFREFLEREGLLAF
jgi:DNA polymerase I